jgi:hypothetical protein
VFAYKKRIIINDNSNNYFFALDIHFPMDLEIKEKISRYDLRRRQIERCLQIKWRRTAELQWISAETGRLTSRGSEAAAEMSLLMSRMKNWLSAQIGPKVSMAMGTNR